MVNVFSSRSERFPLQKYKRKGDQPQARSFFLYNISVGSPTVGGTEVTWTMAKAVDKGEVS